MAVVLDKVMVVTAVVNVAVPVAVAMALSMATEVTKMSSFLLLCFCGTFLAPHV